MNRAWLLQRDEGDEWEIVFSEPSFRSGYFAIKEIVWAEVREGKPT